MKRIAQIELLLLLFIGALTVSYASEWHDPSPHDVQFVNVDDGVNLEVLDWGGNGQDVVLLAGSGNTAHVFDDFAPKLSQFCHVWGITRRGYGTSTHPASGYSEQRLADDVLQVIDFLKLRRPVLMGHSMSGEELTRLGDEHPDRLAGLIYLDAADDPADFPASSPAYMALFQKLPQGARTPPPDPTDEDLKSFRTFYKWQVKNRPVAFPESELHNQYEEKPDGSVGEFKTDGSIHEAIGAGALKRDYSRIQIPVLAFFPIVGDKSHYQPKNAQEADAIRAFDDATRVYVARYKANLRRAHSGVRIVDLHAADHYVFLSNEQDVLRETHNFLAGLKHPQTTSPTLAVAK